jgi:hypothetical protein
MIRMRDCKEKVVYGDDNLSKKVQKRLLMSSYCELHLYMIETFPGMFTDSGDICYSEDSVRKIMPKNLKKAGEQYKQMCGYHTCVIVKDMYQNVKLWQKQFIRTKQQEIDALHVGSRSRMTKTELLA